MVQFLRKHTSVIFLCMASICIFIFLFLLPQILSSHYTNNNSAFVSAPQIIPEKPFVPSYVSTPEPVKAIYMTSWTASGEKTRAPLVKLIDETEINTVVIDIKDYSGRIVFKVENPELKKLGSEEIRIVDLQNFIESLHQKGIYVIGRVAVFQDAYFVKIRPDLAVKNASSTAVWKDRKGISWIDVGSHEYWDYIVQIALESRKIGFDEINFDYVRYPSDGDMRDISFPWSSTTPKAKMLKNFFSYLHDSLDGSGLKTSADLFGMTTTTHDDMGIGQVLENALPYFDYVSPMVYPSHYPTNFMGYADPEKYPYEVIQYTMQSAVTRAELLASTTGKSQIEYKDKLRPWLQDFGLRMTYGTDQVRAQIKATNDVGLTSWLLWSASNRYTKGALELQN